MTKISKRKNLSELAANTDDEWWLVVIAHMNAEMARMNNDFDRANRLYDESMEMSQRIGSESMVATECFNKSLVALAQGKNDMAFKLLQRHFHIRAKLDDQDVDPYGLIGLVCHLVAVGKIEHAAETAFVCRRLLGAKNVGPDPADEAPLNSAEEFIRSSLSEEALAQCESTSINWNCREVAHRYIGS